MPLNTIGFATIIKKKENKMQKDLEKRAEEMLQEAVAFELMKIGYDEAIEEMEKEGAFSLKPAVSVLKKVPGLAGRGAKTVSKGFGTARKKVPGAYSTVKTWAKAHRTGLTRAGIGAGGIGVGVGGSSLADRLKNNRNRG